MVYRLRFYVQTELIKYNALLWIKLPNSKLYKVVKIRSTVTNYNSEKLRNDSVIIIQ